MNKWADLAFILLQAKFIYYKRPDLPGLSDAEYDKIEDEYRKLCKEEGIEPFAADMVDFDYGHPLSQIVVGCVLHNKGILK